MKTDPAKLAVTAYAARNKVCRSDSMRLQNLADKDGRAQKVYKDLDELLGILPNDQTEHADNCRYIIRYFRDTDVYYNSEGQQS